MRANAKIALQGKGASKAQTSERGERTVANDRAMVDEFLKLYRGLLALMQRQVGLGANKGFDRSVGVGALHRPQRQMGQRKVADTRYALWKAVRERWYSRPPKD